MSEKEDVIGTVGRSNKLVKKIAKAILYVVLAITLVGAVSYVVGGIAYQRMFQQQEAVTK